MSRPFAAIGIAVWLAGAPAAVAAAGDPTDSLRDAVALHPDDRDLAWALARSLADTGREGEESSELERLVARWPEHAGARLRLGTLLESRGRHAEALVHLERAAALDPGSGAVRMMLGAVLGQLRRYAEAERELVLAAELEPRLRAESLLLRAVARIEQGDLSTGLRLLEEVIELDPLSDVADAARLLLATAARPKPRLRLQAYGGMDYDSNVTLDSGSTPGVSADRDNGAGVWGAMIAGDALAGRDHTLTLGARYHERNYLDLDDFDERTFLGFVTGDRRLGRATLRVSAVGSYLFLGDDPYLAQVKLRPDLLLWLSEPLGILQLGPSVEGHLYDEDPPFSSLERDAISFGGALRHLLPIPGDTGARGSWGLEYERFATDAERDLLGFEGDYDRHVYGGHVRADLPLPWRWRSDLSVAARHELYDHDSLIDFLAQLEADGTAHRRSRRDVVLETGVGLARAIHDHVDLELRWRFQRRFSNTRIYDYDRHVVGAMVRIRSF